MIPVRSGRGFPQAYGAGDPRLPFPLSVMPNAATTPVVGQARPLPGGAQAITFDNGIKPLPPVVNRAGQKIPGTGTGTDLFIPATWRRPYQFTGGSANG